MKKIYFLTLIFAMAILLSACGTSYLPSNQNTPVNSNTNQPAASGPANISIANFSFNPNSITLKAPANITFTNNDSVNHQIASDFSFLNSQVLQSGNAFTTTITQPGTYSYHCAIHPFMTGSIVVE